jgi:hypothetical protein
MMRATHPCAQWTPWRLAAKALPLKNCLDAREISLVPALRTYWLFHVSKSNTKREETDCYATELFFYSAI